MFGYGGLIGIALWWHSAFRAIAVPIVTLPWFLSIAGFATLEVYVDPGRRFLTDSITTVVFHMGEATEMMVAIAGMLYVALRRKHLNSRATGSSTE